MCTLYCSLYYETISNKDNLLLILVSLMYSYFYFYFLLWGHVTWTCYRLYIIYILSMNIITYTTVNIDVRTTNLNIAYPHERWWWWPVDVQVTKQPTSEEWIAEGPAVYINRRIRSTINTGISRSISNSRACFEPAIDRTVNDLGYEC